MNISMWRSSFEKSLTVFFVGKIGKEMIRTDKIFWYLCRNRRISLRLEKAGGFECVGYCEIDRYAKKKHMKQCMIQETRCITMMQERSTLTNFPISTMGKNYYRRQWIRTRYQLQEIQAGREYFGRDRKTEYRCWYFRFQGFFRLLFVFKQVWRSVFWRNIG